MALKVELIAKLPVDAKLGSDTIGVCGGLWFRILFGASGGNGCLACLLLLCRIAQL